MMVTMSLSSVQMPDHAKNTTVRNSSGISYSIARKLSGVKMKKDKLDIIINKQDNITQKLITNMLNCLKELEKKYPQNIEIIDKEE